MGAVCRDSGTNGEGVVAAAILAAVSLGFQPGGL